MNSCMLFDLLLNSILKLTFPTFVLSRNICVFSFAPLELALPDVVALTLERQEEVLCHLRSIIKTTEHCTLHTEI